MLVEDYISPIYKPLLFLLLLMLAGVVALVARWIAFPGDRGFWPLLVGGPFSTSCWSAWRCAPCVKSSKAAPAHA
ncbi:hypothetical protein [Frigidibacter mobilis]|uniref:Cellulose synthase n=1 Tax=Frigidibacter mobilis TaxID=1335048 RepID=A0A159Z516_9RHOB|nr:hypothetical protein [Frigidibacter mobilis]AMY70307.1 cellulose synthase [Frigidibacter mobilis]